MAAYTAVVTLMQDLEQLLSSYSDFFGLEQGKCPFTKEEVEILYHNVSLMDFLLRDSSGESYNREFMNEVSEKRISDIARKAGNYVDCWAVKCLQGNTSEFVDRAVAESKREIASVSKGLQRILDGMNVRDSEVTSSPGTSLTFWHPFLTCWGPSRRTPNTEGKVVGLENDLAEEYLEISRMRENIKAFNLIRKEASIGAALRRKGHVTLTIIREEILPIMEELQKIHGDRNVRELEATSSPGASLTFSGLSRRTPNTESKVVGLENDLAEEYLEISRMREKIKASNQLTQDRASIRDALQRTGRLTLNEIRTQILLIMEELQKIHDDINVRDLEVTSSPGTSLTFWDPSRRTPNTEGKVVGLENDLAEEYLEISRTRKNIIAPNQLTQDRASIGDALQRTGRLTLKEIRKKILPFMEELQKIHDDINVRDSEVTSSPGASVTFSSPSGSPNTESKVVGLENDLAEVYLVILTMRTKIKAFKLVMQLGASIGHALQGTGRLILNEITEEIVSITEELQKIHDDRKVPALEVTSSQGKSLTFLSPSRRTPTTGGELVGLENDLVTMLDSLTGYPSQLKVFSITGMAGIGKTTFSRTLYHNPLVMHHFYVRAWITVSQQYQVREMLLGILRCVANVSDEVYGKCNEELKEQLYRSLKGKRYLIVLDDMWDTKAWDDLKRTLPDDGNGSRILLTSRLRDVAAHASQGTPPHSLRCLRIDESWELLSSKIFVDESCPMELESIGKQIAYKCQGLPLALVVAGGLLSKMNRKVDAWEEVAQSVGSLLMEEAEHCQDILVLSYSHLPDQLKACFLYMGIFPEDYEISVKKLIWLWIAEGFIRPSMLKSLEEVAEDYLEDLTGRSLILVKRRSSDGRIKTCYIHDLMRELCLREAQKQNFVHVINSSGQLPLKSLHDDLPDPDLRQVPQSHLHNLRRLSFHSSICEYIDRVSFPCTRSVVYFEKLSASDGRSHLSRNFKLLKVLDIMNIHLRSIPMELQCFTLLKFLALTAQDSSKMGRLLGSRQLQTLILHCQWNGDLPYNLWDMLELRHFHLKGSSLRLPPTYFLSKQLLSRVQNNLQSLSTIRAISCTKEVFCFMPNLKKLGILETEEDYRFRGWFYNLVHLRELEKLKYVFSNPFVRSNLKSHRLPSWNSFPPKLRKLTLCGTSLPWDDMFKLSMLPKLEVLKLRNYAFSGAVWKCTEGGFRCLKFLLIGSTNLEIWEAEGTDFPNLQHLVLRHCRSFKEIPYGIGEAPLLRKIELHCCKVSAVMSARQIQEEQQSLGNDDLTIQITEG